MALTKTGHSMDEKLSPDNKRRQ